MNAYRFHGHLHGLKVTVQAPCSGTPSGLSSQPDVVNTTAMKTQDTSCIDRSSLVFMDNVKRSLLKNLWLVSLLDYFSIQ